MSFDVALSRYAGHCLQDALQAREGIAFRWAMKRAMQHFEHCQQRGLAIEAEPPCHLRLDDEAMVAGYVVALQLWKKWIVD